MRADFKVCIDACVLANIAVCDLLLRLAEKPRLFLPIWSSKIMEEVRNTQLNKLNWLEQIVDSYHAEVARSFPDSWVDDYEHILPVMTNDEKDRHVLAATVRSGSSVIVTFNLKDFPLEALKPWRIEAIHPQDYLITLYSMSPEIIVNKLHDISRKRNLSFEDLILKLGIPLPTFAAHIIDDLSLEL